MKISHMANIKLVCNVLKKNINRFFSLKKDYILNINKDCTKKQNRILVSYLLDSFYIDNLDKVYHPAYLHYIQMINVLIKQDFTIDICYCQSEYALDKLQNIEYDYLLGFGLVYEKLSELNPNAIKLLFITENNPEVAILKYRERIDYFKKRHQCKIKDISRDNFYTKKMYDLSDIGIVMNSEYNSQSMYKYFKQLYRINVNALINQSYKWKEKDWEVVKYNFVWFGSGGFIHKGLDLLLDVFSKNPKVNLNIYGLDKRELSMFKPYKDCSNIFLHDKINVLSPDFIDDVINNNTFVILPSCSEGMSSGVATCMAHGLIPIVTKETGFEMKPFIYELMDFEIDYIDKFIKTVSKLSNEELSNLSYQNYVYSQKEFSLNTFSIRFQQIMQEIKKDTLHNLNQ